MKVGLSQGSKAREGLQRDEGLSQGRKVWERSQHYEEELSQRHKRGWNVLSVRVFKQ